MTLRYAECVNPHLRSKEGRVGAFRVYMPKIVRNVNGYQNIVLIFV